MFLISRGTEGVEECDENILFAETSCRRRDCTLCNCATCFISRCRIVLSLLRPPGRLIAAAYPFSRISLSIQFVIVISSSVVYKPCLESALVTNVNYYFLLPSSQSARRAPSPESSSRARRRPGFRSAPGRSGCGVGACTWFAFRYFTRHAMPCHWRTGERASEMES